MLNPIWKVEKYSILGANLDGGVLSEQDYHNGIEIMKKKALVKNTLIFLLVLHLIFILPVYATTYYVSASGGSDSNPGTEAQPWEHIQHAADVMVAGDSVLIKAGTYNERVVAGNSGAPGNYITYMAYPGDTVTIDGTDTTFTWGGVFHIVGKSYIRVSGLRVINSSEAGIFAAVGSSHIIIEKNYVYNTYSSGIGAWSSDNIIIDSNEVELACNGGRQECITVAVTDTFEVKNNHVHHGGPGTQGGEGIDIKQGSSNGTVFKNCVHDMNRLGIYIEAWDRHTYNIDVFQNIAYACTTAGIALASEECGTLENIRVYNNISFDNEKVGIWIAGWGDTACEHPIQNVEIINNTLYDNGTSDSIGWGGGIAITNSIAQNITVRNNICSQNLRFQIRSDADSVEVTIDHNLIDGYRGDWNEVYGSDSVVGDPMFVSTTTPDFHLQSGSPAIDAGSSIDAPGDDYDGNIRPCGGDYDIGAYEYDPAVNISGVGTKPIDFALIITPNPFNSSVKITAPAGADVKIYDLMGNVVGANSVRPINKGRMLYVPTRTFIWTPDKSIASGIYFVRATMDDGRTIEKKIAYLK